MTTFDLLPAVIDLRAALMRLRQVIGYRLAESLSDQVERALLAVDAAAKMERTTPR